MTFNKCEDLGGFGEGLEADSSVVERKARGGRVRED